MDFEYVTEVAPPAPPPPPPPVSHTLTTGVLDGGLAGLAFLGWETAVTGWLGMQPAVGVAPVAVLALYLATGGICGVLASALGLASGQWLLQAMLFGAGWLVFGLTTGFTTAVNHMLSLPALGALALLLGYYGGAREREHSAAGAVGIALFLSLAVLIPVDVHHLLQPISLYGLGANAGVVLIAGVAGGLCGMVIEDEVPNRHILLGAVAVAWLASVPVLRPFSGAWPRATADHPPVVVMVVGGLRADHLGVYGYERTTTPHIDELASTRGLVFAEATATAPWTVPAVASLFTGRLPSHHTAGTFGDPRSFPLDDRSPLLQEALQAKGYVTTGIVTHALLRRPFGFARGFDYYDDRVGYAVPPAGYLPFAAVGLNPIGWQPYRSAEHVGSRARSFVAAQDASAWMLWVYFTDLLYPLRASADELARVGAKAGDVVADYDAALRRVDTEIGQIVEKLPANAWIVIVGDHGYELSERRQVEDAERPDGERWGHTVFQELVHVPLIVMGPEVQPSWIEGPRSILDLAPTLATLLGASTDGMTGDLLPSLVAGAARPANQVVISEFVRYGEERKAVRRGDYKLVFSESEGSRLYDLKLDPHERSAIRTFERDQQVVVKELESTLPHFARREK